MNDTTPSPQRARVRPLADLAGALGMTRAGIYSAYHRGMIGGVIQVGALLKIRNEAFEYHCDHGYGTDVPPFGASEAA